MMTGDHREALQALRTRVLDTLAPLFDADRAVVWADFPDHGNVGDSAIWLGEMALMSELRIDVAAVLPTLACHPGVVTSVLRRHPDATLAINGGGNLGGIYENHHRARMTLLRHADGRPVVQAPQSVSFPQGWAGRTDLVDALRHTPDLRLAIRDSVSMARLHDEGIEGVACPDIVHILGPLASSPPTQAVSMIRRDDPEMPAAPTTVGRRDWLRDNPGQGAAWAARSAAGRTPAGRAALARVAPARYRGIARRRVARGLAKLGVGQTVVTDRLHALILGLHLGREVIVVDNAIGKISAYHDTWLTTLGLPIVRAENWTHAAELADARSRGWLPR